MSKIAYIKNYRRIDTRSSDLQREVELRERNKERTGEWQLKSFFRRPGGDAA